MKSKEKMTGELFGNLFSVYDDEAFLSSLTLFEKRFKANGFPLDWFQDKNCLDAGCGGGRYSMALSRLGAKHIIGMDISREAIEDAKHRADRLGLSNIEFLKGSVADMPFENETFDCVIHSGVLQHVREPITVLNEIVRVMRPGGIMYALVYATEGLRWPLVQMLRPIAQKIGFAGMDQAIADAGLPVNRRRTYLDDLFVPYIDFYAWPCLKGLLNDKGFSRIERWGKGRFDHEETLDAYMNDLTGFLDVFSAGLNSTDQKISKHQVLLKEGENLCNVVLNYLNTVRKQVEKGKLSVEHAEKMVIGQGHHRIVAWKE